MEHRPAELWEHTTTLNSRIHGQPVGYDLFDEGDAVAIYERFSNGLLFPARTTRDPEVLKAWMARGNIIDHRKFETKRVVKIRVQEEA